MAISVVGFDVGNSTSYIAVARSGGIETIDNEYSDRCTPCMGASAKEQIISNIKSTVYSFPRMVGKSFSDVALQKELGYCNFPVIRTENDGVSYLNEEMILTPEQALAVQLTKLKEITLRHLSGQVYDVVINVPSYFTDAERRAVLDSSKISGLNCVRLVNDTTAVGIAYGIYNKDLPSANQPSRNVAFVLMGQSNLQVAICAYNNGKMKVLSTSSDPYLGGRDFDKAIYDYMCKEFAAKFKLDVSKSAKASIRLLRECEKLKKLMSANSTKLSLNIECFMEDKDVTAFMQRSDFEAAMCSPTFKVKEFCVTDVCPYSITLHWDNDGSISTDGAEETELKCDGNSVELYPYLYPIPSSRQLALVKKGDFVVQARYTNPNNLQIKNPVIGNFKVTGVALPSDAESASVRVKVRVNGHGIFAVTNAQLGEKMEKEIESPKAMDVDQSKTEGDDKTPEDSAAKEVEPKKQTKIVTKWRDLHVQSETNNYPEDVMTRFIEKENEMIQQDKLERNRSNAKNALEEYIYEMRDKLSDSLANYVLESDKDKFRSELMNLEDWLYGEGEDLPCQPYVDKLNYLKSFGEVYKNRLFEAETRPMTLERFRNTVIYVSDFINAYSNNPIDYAHITTDEVEQVSAHVKEKQAWLQEQMNLQSSRALTDEPAVKARDIESQAISLETLCAPIINKPKPVVKPPPPETNDSKENGEKEDNNNTSKKVLDNQHEQPTEKNTGDVEKCAGENECMDLD